MEENQTEIQTAVAQNPATTKEDVKSSDSLVAEKNQPSVPEAKTEEQTVSGNVSADKAVEKDNAAATPSSTPETPAAAPVAPIPPFVARPVADSVTAPVSQNNAGFSQNQMGEGIRKLKKIKRPVKRLPQGNPLPPSSQPINLDELLDSQMNLPTSLGSSGSNNVFSHQEKEVKPATTNVTEKPRVQPRFINESDLEKTPGFLNQLMVDNLFTYKGVAAIAGIVFILTLIIGMMIFGGETVVKDGLQGVVVNAEVPRGRARCGIAERTQGCVLYIMNPQRQDLQGRDFYDLASQLTGRQRFVVETGNMRYSNVKIRAGEIAQINIPPLQ